MLWRRFPFDEYDQLSLSEKPIHILMGAFGAHVFLTKKMRQKNTSTAAGPHAGHDMID
ncbi:hypothetical protein Thpro_022054 [Acidihalobacter prosperus]|uniref:Uncharacterized protein n=1 Tax=Acidihalobacter prosperus TaxID=160660 RepID=A0A1A6C2Z1_9GAMM|nr:hypothetical protein Thpro_022054 [Acidihalobacter prosperus]